MKSDSLTEQIIAAAIEVHRHLGPALLESIYEEALCHELSLRKIPFERQKEVSVFYKGQPIKGQRLDIVVADEVVVELKAKKQLDRVTTAQLISYLQCTGMKRGLVINFGESRLVDGVRGFAL